MAKAEKEPIHEGKAVKEWAVKRDMHLTVLAKKLGMTPQSLHNNLRLAKIRDAFRRLLEEKLRLDVNSEIFHYPKTGDLDADLIRIKQKVYSSNINDLLVELFVEIEKLKK